MNNLSISIIVDELLQENVDALKQRILDEIKESEKRCLLVLVQILRQQKKQNFVQSYCKQPCVNVNAPVQRRRTCLVPSCEKMSQGTTGFCYSHGGGYRCSRPGCNKAARDKSRLCISHGGGKKCLHPGCRSSARGKTKRCIRHSKKTKCFIPGCERNAQGGSKFCRVHKTEQ
eukprot:snap_masked-scaffold_5-processed-gene-6.4-mRNA-1 protein AED:0.14 eAED:0.14 QI:0/-1/0/1/-1/1/1/0/172